MLLYRTHFFMTNRFSGMSKLLFCRCICATLIFLCHMPVRCNGTMVFTWFAFFFLYFFLTIISFIRRAACFRGKESVQYIRGWEEDYSLLSSRDKISEILKYISHHLCHTHLLRQKKKTWNV